MTVGTQVQVAHARVAARDSCSECAHVRPRQNSYVDGAHAGISDWRAPPSLGIRGRGVQKWKAKAMAQPCPLLWPSCVSPVAARPPPLPPPPRQLHQPPQDFPVSGRQLPTAAARGAGWGGEPNGSRPGRCWPPIGVSGPRLRRACESATDGVATHRFLAPARPPHTQEEQAALSRW